MFQAIKVPQGTKSLELHAKGTGPAFIQISYRYNVLKKQSHPSFKVQVTVLPEITPPKLKLNVCMKYVDEYKFKEYNLAILEASLPSGYTSNKDIFKDSLKIEIGSVKESSRRHDF